MLRCALPALALACSLAFAPPAQAQARKFPANALRGEIVVTQPPELLLNGRPARLAPGARIRGMNNMQVLSGALQGQKLVVHYTLEQDGSLHDVWILTAAELARKPWPETPKEAATWSFNTDAQFWSKP